MSEAAPEATPAAPSTESPSTPTEPQSSQPQTFTQDQVNTLLAEQKRKAREQFAGYDDLKTKAEQFDQLQEAAKTEQQRAAEAAARAERERDEALAESLRYKAAATHGIGEDYFDLLGTGDADSINSRAERVGGLIKSAADLTSENDRLKAENEALRTGKPVPTNGRPTESLRPGAVPTAPSQVADDAYPSHWLPSRQ